MYERGLTTATEELAKLVKHSISAIELKHFSVHDQLVKEVKLLAFGLGADVWLFYSILDEAFHLIFV